MSKTDQKSYERNVRALPFIAASCLAVCAAVCSRTVAKWFDAQLPLAPPLVEAIQESQTAFLIAALLLLLFGVTLRWSQAGLRILQRSLGQRLMLSTFVTMTPLFVLETGLRPIAASRHSGIYTIDVQRGWKHRPNTLGYIGQRPAHIDSLGLRGPEVP